MPFEVVKANVVRYRQIEVSDNLTLFLDLDDTWIAIKDSSHLDDCCCIMIDIKDVESLVLKLPEAREMITSDPG